ncbi:YlxR family protein [Corynebacterium atypicum]|uniref:YlxR family protein n=1 Tax=Corynebacterium atypicum TaxID=191610 RepID=UPI001F2E20E0|nr:YlxR family protein [Corynebacterium atypicum]
MPERTCVATRERRADTELLRLVVDPSDPGRIIPDPRRRLPGRGAWISPSFQVAEQAINRRAVHRALRVSVQADAGPVLDYLASHEPKRKTEP